MKSYVIRFVRQGGAEVEQLAIEVTSLSGTRTLVSATKNMMGGECESRLLGMQRIYLGGEGIMSITGLGAPEK